MGIASHDYYSKASTVDEAIAQTIADMRDEQGRYADWRSGDPLIAPRRMTESAARYWARTQLGRGPGRGAALVAETVRDEDATTRTVAVSVNPLPNGACYEALQAALAGITLRPGESIDHWTDKVETTSAKVSAEAPKEATRTVYHVVRDGMVNAKAQGYASQAEARAAAVEMAKNARAAGEWDVIAVSTRVSGAPLVRVTRTVTQRLDVTVTLSTPKPGAPRDGFYVLGQYHI